MSEKPVHPRPRRLADWINPTGAKKVHSLVDKVYKRKNLEMAWERVKRTTGAVEVWMGRAWRTSPSNWTSNWIGCRGTERATPISLNRCGRCRSRRRASRESFARWEFRRFTIGYASKRCSIGWSRSSSRYSMMPTSDIGEGDRRRMPCAKCGRRSRAGAEWIVDADLKDFFGSVDHEKLLTLVAQRDLGRPGAAPDPGRCSRREAMAKGKLFPTERGTPQGGVISPLLSNILLTPFDREMRRKGYRLTRYADDWVVTCKYAGRGAPSAGRSRQDPFDAGGDVECGENPHCPCYPGFRVSRVQDQAGSRPLALPPCKIRSGIRSGDLYAYPRQKSIQHFKDQIRQRTLRKAPVRMPELIQADQPGRPRMGPVLLQGPCP